ncbi:hypothetical protein RMSM_02746 [Rhodopirellula maiorica SM1]|uniref:Uncharacterized protein n=1 Tax=Rhodopirellula maiorica SM1 TaxID=1265738 RepID=M5RMC0_9BACT|nr:hypothetical protein RMSM_02746 [Rhodopirellula maiorica SM1]
MAQNEKLIKLRKMRPIQNGTALSVQNGIYPAVEQRLISILNVLFRF